VLDLDGTPRALQERTEAREADVTIGADGFSYTRAEEAPREFKLGNQV
jgi:catechol 2,3-dioxygenase